MPKITKVQFQDIINQLCSTWNIDPLPSLWSVPHSMLISNETKKTNDLKRCYIDAPPNNFYSNLFLI